MPLWLRLLDVRSRLVVLNTLGSNPEAAPWPADYSWITPERVREFGRAGFAESPNCGTVTLDRLGAAIGGWSEDAIAESATPAMLAAGRQALRSFDYVPSQDMDRVLRAVWTAMRRAAR